MIWIWSKACCVGGCGRAKRRPKLTTFSSLRFLASVGEPLNPEGVVWGKEVFGHPFRDNWGQTETGGIMIANMAAEPIMPGSMGRPLPGIQAGIVDTEGEALRECAPGEIGELAQHPGWPTMMRAYPHEEARYRKAFRDGWYLSGDLAMKDEQGYFWFVGRADDLIKSSGHLIGPFEVESALIEHPAVAEAGVIGRARQIRRLGRSPDCGQADGRGHRSSGHAGHRRCRRHRPSRCGLRPRHRPYCLFAPARNQSRAGRGVSPLRLYASTPLRPCGTLAVFDGDCADNTAALGSFHSANHFASTTAAKPL